MPVTIHIKNMVCQRCVRVVSEELERAGFKPMRVQLGEAELNVKNYDKQALQNLLTQNGFELLDDKPARLVNNIKSYVIDWVRSGKPAEGGKNLSELIEARFNKEYGYISHLFSQAENTTLEKYVIAQKIELVKEWLAYNELTLSEMAYRLGYSSVAHLSNQFKQVTGFTPTAFKQLKQHHRKGIDQL